MRIPSAPAAIGDLYMSPDGRYLVTFCYVDAYPDAWKEYTDPIIHNYIAGGLPKGTRSFIERSVLIDIQSQTTRTLLDAPVVGGRVISWPDGKSVVVGGTYLSLAGTTGQERDNRRDSRWTNRLVVTVAIPSGEVLKSDVRRRGDNQDEVPTLAGARRPTVLIDEDMNTPPRLFIVNPLTHKRTLLMDLNPQFRALKFARVEEIIWRSGDGSTTKGGLYYPLGYVPGRRYPLVIQTHGWWAGCFCIDGPYTTGYAAQPLAGHDIMVLQVDAGATDASGRHVTPADFDTQGEVHREVARFEGAIKDLSDRGFIDPDRVGIMGFSRTGLWVGNALAFSQYHFAAASVEDAIGGGYVLYMMAGNQDVGEDDLIYGARPFGEGLKTWMQLSSGFNLDKINAPLRLVSPTPEALFMDWEYFTGLRRLGKPVEQILLHEAGHEVTRPTDRLVSQGGNVDWFRFWLAGQEDRSDAGKTAQYQRWEQLCDLQRQTDPGHPAFCLGSRDSETRH